MKTQDALGQEIIPGNFIAYAVRRRSCPHLKIGKVMAIKHSIQGAGVKTLLSVRGVERNADGSFCQSHCRSSIRRIDRVIVVTSVPLGVLSAI